jgi:hypothetical protein
MNTGSSMKEEVMETDCEITHLPSEILEFILLNFSYAEIAQLRQVNRWFRVVADEVLDRKFRCLKARAESHLAVIVQKFNAPFGTGSTENDETDSYDIALYKHIVFLSRKLIEVVCSEIRLLRAVCYRPLYLSGVPQNVLYSSAYFKGNIIDVTHRMFRITFDSVQASSFHRFVCLVNQWMLHFFKKLGPSSAEDICARNNSKCSDLFGSKVIDLLESIKGCKKDVTVTIDSGGWCYIKGEYKLRPQCNPPLPRGTSGKKPLTVKEQAALQNMLFYLARFQYDSSYFDSYSRYSVSYNNALLKDFRVQRNEDYCYYDRRDLELTFKVNLKCRTKLAPVEVLVELLKGQLYESVPGAHTAQYPSPDLELKMEVEKGSCRLCPRTRIYKCLIRHGHKPNQWCQWLYAIRKLWLRLWMKMMKICKLT